MSYITCKDLALGYEGKPIISDLNFSVEPGEYFVVLGENGSGKSTLMKTLLNLQAPISGSIEFGDDLRQNDIGYLPQQTMVQRDFPASVNEIVLSGCQGHCGLRPFYSRKNRETADQIMEKLRISHLKKSCYRELSGGQQQRVLLARALCATRKVLILDEPVSGLDPRATLEMYQLIEQLNKEDHVTIIMISHDLESALRYATHILHIGDQVFCGTREEYLNSKACRAFLAQQEEADHE